MKGLELIFLDIYQHLHYGLQILKAININSFLSTFAGPLNLLGVIDRDLGFYEPIYINIYNSTNIFTVFRSIVSDFSPLGAIILFFIIGFYFQIEFQKKKKIYLME